MRNLLAAFGLMVVLGCGPSEVTRFNEAPPPSAPEPGWRVHVGDGYYFFGPDNWQIPASHSEMTDPDALKNLSNPAVGYGAARPSEAANVGASVYIVDVSGRSTIGEARTQLLVKRDTGGRTNLKIEADRLRKKVPSIQSEEALEFPIGPAHEFVTLRKTVGGDQIHEIYIVLVNEHDVYTFRFVSTGSNIPILHVARPMVETFRLGSPPADALPAEIENPFGDLPGLGQILGDR